MKSSGSSSTPVHPPDEHDRSSPIAFYLLMGVLAAALLACLVLVFML